MAGDLVAALARAQAKMPQPKKSRTNPHFRSTYADLSDVLHAVTPALTSEGIALIQIVDGDDLVTQLWLGEERFESRLPVNHGVKPQELGSQLTYLRRYSISAICGVASEDDDDGTAAQTVNRSRAGGGAPYREDGDETGTRPARASGSSSASTSRPLSPKILGARMNSHGYDAVKKTHFVTAVVGELRKLDDCTPDELALVAAALDRVDGGELPTFTPAGCILPWDGEPFALEEGSGDA